MNVTLCIPSYGRAEQLVAKSPFVEHSWIAVDEPQVDEYQRAFDAAGRQPRGIVRVPETKGLTHLRNVVLDALWSEGVDSIFMLDDDVTAVHHVGGYSQKKIEVDEALEAIEEAAAAAQESGTPLYGFGTKIVTEFSSFAPISHVAIVPGYAIGIVGDKALRFDPDSMLDSEEISIRVALKHGHVWVDNRFMALRGRDRSFGGASKWRLNEGYREACEYINKKFAYLGGRPMVYRPKRKRSTRVGVESDVHRLYWDQLRITGP